MVALYAAFYNFIRSHKTLRMTPGMSAGIVDSFYGFEDILARIDAKRAPRKRGAYKAPNFKLRQYPAAACLDSKNEQR